MQVWLRFKYIKLVLNPSHTICKVWYFRELQNNIWVYKRLTKDDLKIILSTGDRVLDNTCTFKCMKQYAAIYKMKCSLLKWAEVDLLFKNIKTRDWVLDIWPDKHQCFQSHSNVFLRPWSHLKDDTAGKKRASRVAQKKRQADRKTKDILMIGHAVSRRGSTQSIFTAFWKHLWAHGGLSGKPGRHHA